MEQAKSAIKNLTSHHGQHDTTVHEHHKPAVTHEHITPTRHDEGTTVVDREVHQDHYHTSVQPVQHREVLPEKHTHNQLETEHKEFHHGDSGAVKERLAGEAAQYQDASKTGDTKFTKSLAPEVGGEHVHHHIHESIQPVVQKETIQPTVVHTTKPVHEVHHNAAQHHTATVLPAVQLGDFQTQGGSLTGAKDRVTHFEGEPEQAGLAHSSHHGHGSHHEHGSSHHQSAAGVAPTNKPGVVSNEESVLHRERHPEPHSGATVDTVGTGHGTTGHHHTTGRDAAGVGAAGAGGAGVGAMGRDATGHNTTSRTLDPRHDADTLGAGRTGQSNVETRIENKMDPRVDSRKDPLQQGAGVTKDMPTREFADTHLGAGAGGNTTQATHTSNFESANIQHEPVQEKKKPSLLDKLNPLKDSDGDGKKGIMK